jgi:hypothetical protein
MALSSSMVRTTASKPLQQTFSSLVRRSRSWHQTLTLHKDHKSCTYETAVPIQHVVLTIAVRFIQRLHRQDHLSGIRRYAPPRVAEPAQRPPCKPNVDAIHARRQFHFEHALTRRHFLGSTRGLHGDDRLRHNFSSRLQPYQLLF